MSRLAAFIDPGRDLEAAMGHVGLADVLGYEAVYDNHILGRDGLGTLASYATVSNRVELGTGVFPAFVMTPLALGQLAATLDEFTGGRLRLGIGTSHREVIEGFHGLAFPASPLTRMRETLLVLRSLFTTGGVAHDGDAHRIHFTFSGFTPRADIRIEVAALGPRMLQLAGELADGVLLWLCDDRYIRDHVVPNVRAGAERAGRDPAEVEIIPAISSAVVETDDGPVRRRLRTFLTTYLSLPFYRSMLADSGWGEVLGGFDDAMADGAFERAIEAIPDELIDSLAAIGSPQDVRDTIERYRSAGATLPAVGPATAEGAAGVDKVLIAAMGAERHAS